MVSPSNTARAAIRARLAEAYEETMGQVCLELGINRPQAIVFELDQKSPNFFQGQLNIEEIEGTTTKSYPLAVLWSQGSANLSREKFRTFSGDVTLFLDINLSWRPAAAQRDHETLGDAVEATLYRIFNDDGWADSHEAIAYAGEIDVVKGPVDMGAEHWRQRIRTRIKVQVDQ